MAELKLFPDFRDYASFNDDFIAANPMLFHHLEGTIQRIFRREIQPIKAFNVIDISCFSSVLLVDNECLIYADQINDDLVSKLAEELEFHRFNRFTFFGTKQIIDALFNRYNVKFDVIKHRIIYECKKVSDNFTYAPGNLSMGNLERLKELGALHIFFSKQWYGTDVSTTKAREFMYGAIVADNLYQWNYNENICAVAQVIYEPHDFPVIGHVITNSRFRNQGFATSMVHRITKGLLEAQNDKCMLSADAKNPASNRSFVKAGYVSTGEYVCRYKKR